MRNCHPKASHDKVERILSEMMEGQRDRARFWIDLKGKEGGARKVLIEYHALRDAKGVYQGCLEVTQEISVIQGLAGEKRLLD